MAIEINRIVKLFEALQHGNCWVGNNFKETLHGVDAVTAVHIISPEDNSIWHLTAHIIYWRTTVVNRLAGNDTPPPFKDMLLPAALNEKTWKQTLHDFETSYNLLHNAIINLNDDQLDKTTVRKNQTFYELIMGCLQHDAYHLGQMMLLKKKQA